MAVFGPGDWQDQERIKRERSGFWTRRYDHFGQTETWTCDKRKLNDAVARSMLDCNFANQFHKNGPGLLDQLFGEGTSRAFQYRTKGDQDMVNMQFTDEMLRDRAMGALQRKNDDMATLGFGYGGTSSTDTSTYTTGTTTSVYIKDELERQKQKLQMRNEMLAAPGAMKDMVNKTPLPKKMPKFKKQLVRTLPFRPEMGDAKNLLTSLQREFDHWAGDQMEILNG